MFIKRGGLALGSTLFFACVLTSTAHADLTQDVLNAIANGRTIRDEIKSLKSIPVPEPTNLDEFVVDKTRAIELGKALFWDMQLGSDGVQACASCHFNAGADSRVKNQLSPGLLNAKQDGGLDPDTEFEPGKGANYSLRQSDFPAHVKADPNRFDAQVLADSNDVISSQGVFSAEFLTNQSGASSDITNPTGDPDGFQVDNVNTRRVERRHTPTVINAAFNHRQFWDGRASNIFNGVNAFGENDPNAVVYASIDEDNLIPVKVRIDNASLASQAVEPPVSDFEMSADGRAWRNVGHRLMEDENDRFHIRGRDELELRPLAKQMVDPTDSVLGRLSRGRKPGLEVETYDAMIEEAFHREWWDSELYVRFNSDGTRSIVDEDSAEDDEQAYTQMEMNFSLFFGLAVQLYEATLVSDDSPVDRFLNGDATALTQSELVGFHLADQEARCLNCHGRGEFTFAAVSRVQEQGKTRIRRGDLIDEGFNNIGLRPTLEDLGVGGIDPFGNPLSFARKAHLGEFNNPLIDDQAEQQTDLAADGAFKIPTLRNVELTAPYFHNGGEATLEDVIDFYFRGGNFREFNEAESHPVIGFDAKRENASKITGLGILQGDLKNSSAGLNVGAGLDSTDKANIVAFLKALTDKRVYYRQAPFDHPSLCVPNGHPGDIHLVTDSGDGNATDSLLCIDAVGANGGEPLPTFADNLAP